MITDEIIALARQQGILRADDVRALGGSRTTLPYLARRGILRRVAPGAYMLADRICERGDFVEVAAAVPHGVFCLLSALQFHELTTQMPNEVWMAIERGRHVPRLRSLPIRIVKLGGASFSSGIQEETEVRMPIRVYSPAKTVVDCFKFRNKIGLEVAIEALNDSLAQHKATRDDIWQLAGVCRMKKVMRPYLEMAR